MSLLFNLWAWAVILALGAGGLAFNLFSYYVGKRGMEAVHERFPRIDPERLGHVGAGSNK
jgi:membrane protein DedA with SNARE-associated domain